MRTSRSARAVLTEQLLLPSRSKCSIRVHISKLEARSTIDMKETDHRTRKAKKKGSLEGISRTMLLLLTSTVSLPVGQCGTAPICTHFMYDDSTLIAHQIMCLLSIASKQHACNPFQSPSQPLTPSIPDNTISVIHTIVTASPHSIHLQLITLRDVYFRRRLLDLFLLGRSMDLKFGWRSMSSQYFSM